MGGWIDVDDSRWPILVVRFVGDIERDAAVRYFRRIADYLARDEPYVTVTDIDEIQTRGNQALKDETNVFAETNGEAIGRLGAGLVTVASSPLARTALKAYYLFNPPPQPRHKVVANLADALPVAEQMLARFLAERDA